MRWFTFGGICFNAPPRPLKRGVAEGESLASLLGVSQSNLPWERAFGGKPAVTSGDASFLEVPRVRGRPQITLLLPTAARLTEVFKKWSPERAKLRRKESDQRSSPHVVTRGLAALDIAALAQKDSPTDRSVSNGSAIAMLLEPRGAWALLGADAFMTLLGPALNTLVQHLNRAGALKVDVSS